MNKTQNHTPNNESDDYYLNHDDYFEMTTADRLIPNIDAKTNFILFRLTGTWSFFEFDQLIYNVEVNNK